MAKTNIISKAAEIDGFPDGVQRPTWLHSNYHDRRWLTSGLAPNDLQPLRFDVLMSDGSYLTDPQHAHLLDTVKRMTIGLRTGPYASVTNTQVHAVMMNAIVTWVLWMKLNDCHFFRKLTRHDLEVFTEKAIFGVPHLLQFPARIKKHISNLKVRNIRPPNAGRLLDVPRLLQDACVDWRRAVHDPACSYEVFRYARDEGLYLYPRQLQLLLSPRPIPHRITQINVLRILQPWEYQWQMRRILPGDRIGFDPFPDERIVRVAEKLGVESGRTKTVPIYQAMFLIDRSIRWVLDYSESILGIIKQADLIAQHHRHVLRYREKSKEIKNLLAAAHLPIGPGQPWPISPAIFPDTKTDFAIVSSLRALFASCFIVIAAFTARRQKEITSSRAKTDKNELCTTSDEFGHWIELWIEKTTRGWDKTPCPEVVVRAVEVLLTLSESARTITGTPQLFQYKLLGRQKTATFRVMKGLREFIGRIDVPPLPNGSKWQFSPHQFRRFFAIMYVWRYECGDLLALSHQLRHYNLDMTRRYVTEPTQGKIFREVQTEHSVFILKEVALGRRDAGGPFGERFKKVAKRIRSQMISTVHVFTEEKFAKQIERLILRSGKLLKGFPWGYCTCGSSQRDLSQAKCVETGSRSVSRGPDESKATLRTCASCPHHLTHEGFHPYVTSQIELHEKAAKDKKNGALVRKASALYLTELKQYSDRSFRPSKNVSHSNARANDDPSSENRTQKSGGRLVKDRRKNRHTSGLSKKGNSKRSIRAEVT